jgi:uncharacterized protein
MEIRRSKELRILSERLAESPVVAILGPRQCGKTTLAHQFARMNSKTPITFFDFENPQDLAKFDHPLLALQDLSGIIIIDEIQRKPELFPTIRVLVDKNPKAKYLVLGSASRDLIAQSSESLAGRISYVEMGGFSLDTISVNHMEKLWVRGSFPRSYLAKTNESSFQWRQDFISTFLERDVPNLGIRIPAPSLRRFWMMLSHYHGQIFNASEIGKSLGISDTTARRYLDILSGTFIIRQLQPWYYNTKKRLVKRPKLYFRDSGIINTFLSTVDNTQLMRHPKLGSSWEGFALEQAIQYLNLKEEEVFFWAVHTGAEIDMVFKKNGRLWGIECKYHDAPKMTKSIISAQSELSLEHVWIIYPGKKSYQLNKHTSVIPLSKLNAIKTK